jgi:hypothetical protein
MKIAVYTIALNEAKHVERWAESAKDADYLVILDTGSTDETVSIAKNLDIIVGKKEFYPFKFDEARNAALKLVPNDADWCISMDMDEILLPGWREKLEASIKADPGATIFGYEFINNRLDNGEPGQTLWRQLCHTRRGGRWVWPIHEMYESELPGIPYGRTTMQMEHLPDQTKSRGNYLSMLERATREMPRDSRMSFYYGRELFFHRKIDECIAELKRCLTLNPWEFEESESMLMLAGCEKAHAEQWLLKACAVTPDRREPFVALASLYMQEKRWFPALGMGVRALDMEERNPAYISTPDAWNHVPWDICAVSAHMIGYNELAIVFGERALSVSPEHPQLLENMKWYKGEKVADEQE